MGSTSTVQLLLKHGADKDAKSTDGYCSLHYAAEKGPTSAVELLLKAGSSVDVRSNLGRTPLFYAVWNEHKEIVELLLKAGASVDAKDNEGLTSLHLVASKGWNEGVVMLLESGATLDSKTNSEETPHQIASKYGKDSAAKLLDLRSQNVKESAPPSITKDETKDDTANSSYMHAHPNTQEESYPTNNPQPKFQPTPDQLATLTKAVHDGSSTVVSDYIDQGVDLNTINQDGDTLLHLAVRAQQDSIIDLLLRADGIDIHARNNNNETPMILAIKLGHRRHASQIHAFARQSIASFDVPDSAIVIDFKSPLGVGAFGCVYKGTYNNDDVAVKTAHDNSEKILRQEISVLTKYQSPYIVDVVAVSSSQDHNPPKLALQYMDCGDLRQYLNAKRDGYTTSITVTPLEVAWVLANALADLHHNSTLHRDLKSQNILLSTKHYIKLGDLGISREFTLNTMTHTGTPCWEAPEVLRGERYDYAADMYSFGVILSELDTLQVPYSDLKMGLWNITQQICDGKLRPALSSSCEPWLKHLADKCLSFNPMERPTSRDVVDMLRSVLSNPDKRDVILTDKKKYNSMSSSVSMGSDRESIKSISKWTQISCEKCKVMNHISATECSGCSSATRTIADKIATMVKRAKVLNKKSDAISMTVECRECLGENDLCMNVCEHCEDPLLSDEEKLQELIDRFERLNTLATA